MSILGVEFSTSTQRLCAYTLHQSGGAPSALQPCLLQPSCPPPSSPPPFRPTSDPCQPSTVQISSNRTQPSLLLSGNLVFDSNLFWSVYPPCQISLWVHLENSFNPHPVQLATKFPDPSPMPCAPLIAQAPIHVCVCVCVGGGSIPPNIGNLES